MTAPPMVTIKVPYIVEDVDRHGNVRIYFRRHGRKERVRERIGSDAFHRRYAALMAGTPEHAVTLDRLPKSNTLRWLFVQFLGSADFKRLDPRTQYTSRGIIEAMLHEPIAPGAGEAFAGFSSIASRQKPSESCAIAERTNREPLTIE
jgi:hypothetical protein